LNATKSSQDIAAHFVVSLYDQSKMVASGIFQKVLTNVQKFNETASGKSLFLIGLSFSVYSLTFSFYFHHRCCLCNKGYAGNKCKLKLLGLISLSKAKDLIKVLTSSSIKKLSGLDDVNTEKGCENFIQLRKLSEKLISPTREDDMKKSVDAMELFHQLNFDKHLKWHSKFAWACLSCGFYDNGKTT
jgi:hypothetical protein